MNTKKIKVSLTQDNIRYLESKGTLSFQINRLIEAERAKNQEGTHENEKNG